MVVVERLVKRYNRRLALKNVSFTVGGGEVLGLLGPNGAGKTTTLRAIAGVLRPTGGRVTVMGLDAYRESRRVRMLVGVMPELPSMFPELSVMDNLAFTARLYGMGRGEAYRRASRLIGELGLSGYSASSYASLSKGLKRRVDLAAALIHDPPVLVLDEPTTGLDVFAAEGLKSIVRRLAGEGRTIILSSHYIDEVMELSDRVVILYKGVKMADKRPRELREMLGLGKRLRVYVDPPVKDDDIGAVEDGVHSRSSVRVGSLRVQHGVLEFYTSNPLGDLDYIRGLLESLGYRVVDVDMVPPSWRDVFSKYIEDTASDEGACSCGCA